MGQTQVSLIERCPKGPFRKCIYLDFDDLFFRLAREAKAARPRPLERDCFLVGVVTCEEGERGVVVVVTGESGEDERTVLGVC